MTSTDLIWCSD